MTLFSEMFIFVLKTIKELLISSKTNKNMSCEVLNMLFLLWNFAMLSVMVEGCPMINFGPLLARLSLDTFDELYMTIKNRITRNRIYFVKKAKENFSELTNRLYSNGIEALLFCDHTRLKSILTEYSNRVIAACSKLLKIRKIFTAKTSLMLYFILHLPLLLFEHGRRYPTTISIILDKALKAIAAVIVYYCTPFVNRFKNMGCQLTASKNRKEHEILLECGEVASILLKTNINVALDCSSCLRDFTEALHLVCSWRFTSNNTMYIGNTHDWFSLYHTTLLHGLFELNYAYNKKYMYQIVK